MRRRLYLAAVVAVTFMIVTSSFVFYGFGNSSNNASPSGPVGKLAELVGLDGGVSGEYAELQRKGLMKSSLALESFSSHRSVSAADADGDGEIELAFENRIGSTAGTAADVTLVRRAVRITNRGNRPAAVSVSSAGTAVTFIGQTGSRVMSFFTGGSMMLQPGQSMTVGAVARNDALVAGKSLPTRVTISAEPVGAGSNPGRPGGGAGIDGFGGPPTPTTTTAPPTTTTTTTTTTTAPPTTTTTTTTPPGSVDSDGDGLTNKREQQLGTDPSDPDTDDDLLKDAQELQVGMDPLDPDSDASITSTDESGNNIRDGEEDFGGDGLPVSREFKFGTDPRLSDTDGDGLDDTYELIKGATDPLDTATNGQSDTSVDTDGDGLTTAEEQRLGTWAWIADSDNDGIADNREQQRGTDPASNDTDRDGLVDGAELRVGADPEVTDSDGDGTLDGNEVYTTVATNSSLDTSVRTTGRGVVADTVRIERLDRSVFNTDAINESSATPIVSIENGSSFREATVTFDYQESAVPGDETNLSVYRFNRTLQTFVELDSTVRRNSDTVSATVSEFSTFVAFNNQTWQNRTSSNPPRPLTNETWRIPVYLDSFTDRSVSDWDKTFINKDPTRDGGGGGFPGFGGGGGLPDPVNDQGSVSAGQQRLKVKAYGCFVTRATKDVGQYNGTVNVRFDWKQEGINEFKLHKVNVTLIEDGTPIPYAVANGTDPSNKFSPISGTANLTAQVDGNLSIQYSVRADPPTGAGFTDSTCSLTYQAGKNFYIDNLATSITVKNPVDDDHDLLPTSLERQGIPLGTGKTITTDPTDPDTDNDGLEDGAEIRVNRFISRGNQAYFVSQSNPLEVDSDRGLNDYDERQFGTNPERTDSDGDDITDRQDYLPLVPRSVDRTPASARAKALVEGAVYGAAGAPGGVVRSAYYDEPAYVVGEILSGTIPVVGAALDIRDLAANILQGMTIGAVVNAASIAPGPTEAADAVQTLRRYNIKDVTRGALRRLVKGGWGLQLPTSLKEELIGAAGYATQYNAFQQAGINASLFMSLLSKLPDDIPLSRVQYAKPIDGSVYYLTGVRWDQIRDRHVTGTRRPDDVTRFYPTGAGVPAGQFRTARTLPNRMNTQQVRGLLFEAADAASGSNFTVYSANQFGIDNLRILASTQYSSVTAAYPESGSAVYEWNGTDWVRDPQPLP